MASEWSSRPLLASLALLASLSAAKSVAIPFVDFFATFQLLLVVVVVETPSLWSIARRKNLLGARASFSMKKTYYISAHKICFFTLDKCSILCPKKISKLENPFRYRPALPSREVPDCAVLRDWLWYQFAIFWDGHGVSIIPILWQTDGSWMGESGYVQAAFSKNISIPDSSQVVTFLWPQGHAQDKEDSDPVWAPLLVFPDSIKISTGEGGSFLSGDKESEKPKTEQPGHGSGTEEPKKSRTEEAKKTSGEVPSDSELMGSANVLPDAAKQQMGGAGAKKEGGGGGMDTANPNVVVDIRKGKPFGKCLTEVAPEKTEAAAGELKAAEGKSSVQDKAVDAVQEKVEAASAPKSEALKGP
ncbi:hypothetical protein SELMODRAFT_416421 [Selaginella moellendorffii]|uniref:Uncharacterized protein n=1 Tax=Selaginella moellendorffii TaxID=88036 RepID=D8RZ83_SELML|nr:hypothetical protein SELMODRAFT_416421 [Selaginella moellendorffii]